MQRAEDSRRVDPEDRAMATQRTPMSSGPVERPVATDNQGRVRKGAVGAVERVQQGEIPGAVDAEDRAMVTQRTPTLSGPVERPVGSNNERGWVSTVCVAERVQQGEIPGAVDAEDRATLSGPVERPVGSNNKRGWGNTVCAAERVQRCEAPFAVDPEDRSQPERATVVGRPVQGPIAPHDERGGSGCRHFECLHYLEREVRE